MSNHWLNIWSVDLSELRKDKQEMNELLSCEEKIRAGKFLKEEDATRYTKSHYKTREILKEYFANKNSIIQIEKDIDGKPFIKNNTLDLYFNISYRGNVFVMAVSNQKQVGIDVEQIKEFKGIKKFIDFCFSEKEKEIINTAKNKNDKIANLFELWTAKESYVKALGKGITTNMKSIDASNVTLNNRINYFTVQNIKLKNNLEYKAAFAINPANTNIKLMFK